MLRIIYKIKPTAISTKAIFFFFISVILLAACKKNVTPAPPIISSTGFNQVNLVASNSEYNAARTDANLINGWGIAFSPSGISWISSQGASVSLVYDSSGIQVLPPVSIPSVMSATGGHPSGIVFNEDSTKFVLPGGSAAKFIFAGNDGIISGWSSGNMAEKAIDSSSISSYTGVTIANDSGSTFLYAANFKLARIDVFDSVFNEADTLFPDSTFFKDSTLPAGYAPFNIQNIGGQLYVLYAQVSPDSTEEKGATLGYIDIYNPDGSFVQRFASQGPLNAPWGITLAPPGFLNYNNENVVLVGNFGDGTINIFSGNGDFIGTLGSSGKVITIDGLRGIAFPPVGSSVDPNRLYFTAGPNGEKDGLFGYLEIRK